MQILKLIRFPNLLMIAIAQCLIRYTLVVPLLTISQKYILVTNVDFILIVLSTVSIAAAGYIINDIEDRRTDSINKPEKVIVGKKIDVSSAYIMYYLFTLTGILIGFYLQFYRPYQYIGYIHLISAGLLYFYSVTYKGILLLGNIVVSILTALSLALIVLTEPLASSDPTIVSLTAGYCVFAFLISFAREIIKDIEDQEGDAIVDLKTLPVVMGTFVSKGTAFIISLITLLLIFYIQIISEQWKTTIPFLYVLLMIQIPLLLLLLLLIRAKTKKNFYRASLLVKGIMISGIFSMLVFYLAFR